MTADSSIAEVPVGRRRGLVARTRGLEPHTHTDTGHSNIVADSSTGTDGNSREEDRLGQFQCQWGFQCRFGLRLLPGLRTTKELRWPEKHTGTKQFLSA
jgi:hypothetical protein